MSAHPSALQPSSEPRPPVPGRTLQLLAGLRGRLRSALLGDGLLGLGLGIGLAAFLSFGLDYLLSLPRGVRFVFLLAGVALLVLALRRLLRALQAPLTDQDLAALVERANPELAQSLLTAVELTSSTRETASYVSAEMVARVVGDVEERVAGLRLDGILEQRGARRKRWALAALLVAAGAGLLLGGELPGIWLRRNLLLGSDRWPKRTQLALVAPSAETQPILVAMGDDLEVIARVERGSPAGVSLRSYAAGALQRTELMAPAAAGEHRTLIENVSRPFTFLVSGGDDEIGPFDVDVRLRPRIDSQSIAVWCQYPPHTGLPATPEAEPLRFANLKVPTGTRARYRMAASVPIRRAFFVFQAAQAALEAQAATGEQPGGPGAAQPAAPPAGDWPAPGAVELEVSGERTFTGELAVTQSGQYYFQLEAADGFRSVRPDRFRVEAIPDLKPLVRILEPERITEEVTPEATVPIRAAASDDYGLARVVLEGRYFAPGKEQGIGQSFPFPRLSLPLDAAAAAALAAPIGARKPAEDEITIQVSSLNTGGEGAVAPGARFQLYALGADLAGQIGESQIHFLSVVEPDDLLRLLTDQLMVVRDQLREALRRQKSARKDLEDFQSHIALLEKVPAAEARKVGALRQDQERVAQAIGREAQELSRVIARAARNRVGDEKWRSWVVGVRDDVSEIGERRATAVGAQLKALQDETATSTPPVSRLGLIAAEQRGVERDLENAIARLTEFGDVNALVQMLRDLRRRQQEVREETLERIQVKPPVEPQK